MVDFDTYTKLHPDVKTARTSKAAADGFGKGAIGDDVMERDEPPGEPELLIFPSTLVGYNLRQKRWGTCANAVPSSPPRKKRH